MNVKYLRLNKNGRYQLRLTVPKDLVAKVGVKTKLWALDTGNEAEAIKCLPKKLVEAEAYFAALRNEFVLSPVAAEGMADRWLVRELAKDAEERRLADYVEYEEGEESDEVRGFDACADLLSDKARDGDFSGVDEETESVLTAECLVLAWGSMSYERLQQALTLAKIRLLRIQYDRSLGKWERVETPQSAGASPVSSPTIHQAQDAWLKRKKRGATAISDARVVINNFVAMNGDIQIHEITRTQVATLRDRLLEGDKRPRAVATVRKLLGSLSAILQRQVSDGVLTLNPAAGVKVEGPRDSSEVAKDFTIAELNAIFSLSIFAGGADRAETAGGEAIYWLFVLALYTGSRLGELCQLEVEDIANEDGVKLIHIHDYDEEHQIKNTNSRRIVPLHKDVLALGFDRYVSTLDADGRLFPVLRPRGSRGYAQQFTRYGVKIIEAANLPDIAPTRFHGLRHTFITACRNAEISEDIHQRFTGHVDGNVGRTYGGVNVSTLKRAMDRIEFRGLVIPSWEAGRIVETFKKIKGAVALMIAK